MNSENLCVGDVSGKAHVRDCIDHCSAVAECVFSVRHCIIEARKFSAYSVLRRSATNGCKERCVLEAVFFIWCHGFIPFACIYTNKLIQKISKLVFSERRKI